MIKVGFRHYFTAAISLCLVLLSQAIAAEVKIDGKVLDYNRKPIAGALVKLAINSLFDSTDTNGEFRLPSTGAFPSRECKENDCFTGPFIDNQAIFIPVHDNYSQVQIDFFDLRGRHVGVSFQKGFHRGVHRVAKSGLFAKRYPASLYAVQIKCGRERNVLPYFTAGGNGNIDPQKASRSNSLRHIGKRKSVLDTLIIEKEGYVRYLLYLSDFSETYDSLFLVGKITLTRPAGGETYHIGDTLHVAWELNPGPQAGELNLYLNRVGMWFPIQHLDLTAKRTFIVLTDKIDVAFTNPISPVSDTCRIKIEVSNWQAAGDEGDDFFSIKE